MGVYSSCWAGDMFLAANADASKIWYGPYTGTTYRIQELLDRLLAQATIPIEVRQAAEPGRKADTTITRADTSKLRAATGWEPHIALDQTLADILADWRQRAG